MKSRHSSGNAPARLRIDLPRSLYSKAKRRASESGHSNLADFIISLVQRDVTANGRAGDSRSSRVVVSRESFQRIRKRLLDGMMSHMKASEVPGYGYACGYRLKHIDRCAAIIDAFHTDLLTKPKPTLERILQVVQRAVLKLNKLNATCDGALIETDQREDLCQLMLVAARNAGLKVSEDITERWRNW